MGKWTDQGFIAYEKDYYEEQLRKVFKEAFGSEFTTEASTPQGVLITRLAELLYNTDCDAIEAFARMNLNTAAGVYLDMIGLQRGLNRTLGRPQTISAKIVCNPSRFSTFTIPDGTVFTVVGGGEAFVPVAGKEIKDIETTIQLKCTVDGETNVVIGSKMQVSGFAQILDIEITNVDKNGFDRESDLEYRTRILKEYPSAMHTIQYVENKIRETGMVKTVGHNYNDSFIPGAIAAFATEWLAVPKEGVNEEAFKDAVAKAIVDNKVPGSITDGNTTREVLDIFGSPKTVKFTIPEKIELEIACTVTSPETTGILDLANKYSIIEAMANYINTLDVGMDVSYSRIFSPLAADTGFDVASFGIRKKGTEEWVSGRNFPIGSRQYASITEDDISIEV